MRGPREQLGTRPGKWPKTAALLGQWALLAGVGAGLFGVLTLACREIPAAGGRPLEIVVSTPVSTLDPRFATQSVDIKVTRLIHAGLTGLDATTLEPIPYLAQSWQFLDDRQLLLTLRPGLRFHSGRKLLASDVCATLAALADPALGSRHRAAAQAVTDCQARGDDQVLVTQRAGHATLLTDLEVPILSAEQAHAPAGTLLDGLGPYRVAQADEQAIELVPAESGVMPSPKHALVVRTIRDANVRVLRLMAGRSDIAPNSIPLALLPALEHQPGVTVHASPGANVSYLLLHNERAPFNRVEVRRAVSSAIDRDLIVRSLFAGHAESARWIFPPQHWSSPRNATALPHDLVSAQAALAGVEPVTLLSSADHAKLTVARALAQMLSDAGLSTRVIPLDSGALFERLDRGDYQMAILQMPELTEPNVIRWFFHRDNVPGEGGVGKNRSRYRSDTASSLLDTAMAEPSRERRAQLYAELAGVFAQDMPIVPLWHEDQIAVVSSRAADFSLSAEGRWLKAAALP
jgi:peptide/nickel transport system substrate-binding protein